MSRRVDPLLPVIEALSLRLPTDYGATRARIDVLGHVDGPFSSVQRLRIQTPARAAIAYLKVPKSHRDTEEERARIGRSLEREYEATLAVYRALQQDACIGAVRPIAWLPEHQALVTEEVPGRPLGNVLMDSQRAAHELLAIADAVGKWVRTYQTLGPATGRIELAERRHYLDVRLKLLDGRVFSTADRRAVLDRFDALADRIGASVPAVPIHADLTPMNIIVGADGRVTVLDFTMAKTGTIHHDLSHVFFHLELLAGRHRGKRVTFRALQAAVLAGYDAELSAADPLFRLMLLQHAVCHVALLAERRVPVLDGAYRWFLRRRWQVCERIPGYEVQGAA